MIKLYQPAGAWGLPSLSPFGVKLETYLRMAGLPFEVREANPLKAPKGKMPYVRLENGEFMGDSQFIIEHLERERGEPLDGHLTEAERAVGHSVRRMLDEGYYWVVVYERWVTDEGWRATRPVFMDFLPVPGFVRPILLNVIRKRVQGGLFAQGTGRHKRPEVEDQGIRDLRAVAGVLGDRPYLLGERPTTFDASAYAFVASTLAFPARTPVRAYVESEPRLTGYADRMKSQLWRDPT